jgi:1,4-dihydroxy-2-naphthoyl-CoA hydrolase
MKFHGTLDFAVIEQSAERVVGEMPVQPGLLNPFGVANAGAILWFADVCATVLTAGQAQVAPGAPGFPLAISLNASFLGNQTDGVFKATSTFVKRGRQVSVVRTIVTGAADRLIADVTTSHVPAR